MPAEAQGLLELSPLFVNVEVKLSSEIMRDELKFRDKEKFLKIENSFIKEKKDYSKKIANPENLYLSEKQRRILIEKHKGSYKSFQTKIQNRIQEFEKKLENEKNEKIESEKNKWFSVNESSKKRAEVIHKRTEKFKLMRRKFFSKSVINLQEKKNNELKTPGNNELENPGNNELENPDETPQDKKMDTNNLPNLEIYKTQPKTIKKKNSYHLKSSRSFHKNYGINFKEIRKWANSQTMKQKEHLKHLRQSREDKKLNWRENWQKTPSCRRGLSYDKTMDKTLSKYRRDKKSQDIRRKRLREYNDKVREEQTLSMSKNIKAYSVRRKVSNSVQKRRPLSKHERKKLGDEYIQFVKDMNKNIKLNKKNIQLSGKSQRNIIIVKKQEKDEKNEKEEEENTDQKLRKKMKRKKDYLETLRNEGKIKKVDHDLVMKEEIHRYGRKNVDYFQLANKLDSLTQKKLYNLRVPKNAGGERVIREHDSEYFFNESEIITGSIKQKLKMLHYVYDADVEETEGEQEETKNL